MPHFILPGSLQINNQGVSAGVHTGPNEWTIHNLRYVRGSVTKAPKKVRVQDWLFWIYDNSTGSVIHDDFRMKIK